MQKHTMLESSVVRSMNEDQSLKSLGRRMYNDIKKALFLSQIFLVI